MPYSYHKPDPVIRDGFDFNDILQGCKHYY